jgi:hypothetical protein
MKKSNRPTPNKEALTRLKEQGFEVTVQHFRRVRCKRDKNERPAHRIVPDNERREWEKRVLRQDGVTLSQCFYDAIGYDAPEIKGGATELTLQRGEEKITVRADCYAKDTFCRRLGVKACLEKLEKLHSIKA